MGVNLVVLAGGLGTRLWPLTSLSGLRSGVCAGKALVPFVYGKRLVEVAVENWGAICDSVVVVTSAGMGSAVKEVLGGLGEVEVVEEPGEGRGTFAAVDYVMARRLFGDDDYVLVVPVDGWFSDWSVALRCVEALVSDGNFVLGLLGAVPDRVEVGFGYVVPSSFSCLQAGEGEVQVSLVKEFREKPSREEAALLIRSGALFNVGVFLFRVSDWGLLCGLVEGLRGVNDPIARFVHPAALGSFDRKVVEPAVERMAVKVAKVDCKWFEIGHLKAFLEVKAELEGFAGRQVLGSGNVACSSKSVRFFGCSDLAVIEIDDEILVVRKDLLDDLRVLAFGDIPVLRKQVR